MLRRSMGRAAVLLLFLLSGAAGLIYQVVWMRKLALVLGVTSQAVATVLAVFMGGLALGSWLLGRAGDEARSPLRVYGWLELGIALFGVTSTILLDGLAGLYVEIRRAGPLELPLVGAVDLGDPAVFPWIRLALAGLALLGPTALMGATLPVLIRGLVRGDASVARASGVLYATNTLGAVLGVLFAAFWLIEHVGIRGASVVAAALNLVAGVAALALARREPPLAFADADEPARRTEPKPGERGTLRAVLVAFGISGFAALAYEVLWTRYLIYLVEDNSVYAFATMLASFLIGIALGSWLAAQVADRVRDLVPLLGAVLVLVGATALLTVPLMPVVQDWARLAELDDAPFALSQGRRFLRCLAVLIVPTTLSGSTFALVAKLVARDPASVGRDTGRAYAANTLGAIGGSIAGGFVILPELGLVRGLVAVSALEVLAGLALLVRARPEGRAVRTAIASGVVAAGAFAFVLGSGVDPRELMREGDGMRLVHYADGPESSVAVVEERETGDLSLLVDGEGQAGTEPIVQIHLRLLGHLPLLFHPDPERVLVVAFGAGLTTGCAAQHPVERVDLVELSHDVIEAADHFAPYNHDPLADPKVRLHYDDGRNFLLATDETYDVITSDPIDPDDAGTTSLYCREYYELVRSRLSEDGVACQWITTQYDADEYALLVRTFQDVFPYTSIWHADFTTVVIGTQSPPRVTLEMLRKKIAHPAVAESLAAVGIDDAEALVSLLLAGPDATRALCGPGPLNTDDRPRIEYRGPRAHDELAAGPWRALLDARSRDRSGWIAGWSAADEAACARADAAMDLLAERARIEIDEWAERDVAATVREERSVRCLELTWALLAGDVPRVHLRMAGAHRPEPSSEASEDERALYASSLAEGLAAWRAGAWREARARFAEAATVPGALRPALLAAACRARQDDPIGALEDLLAIDTYGLGFWSSVPTLRLRATDAVLAALAAADDERARATGLRLLQLVPGARPSDLPPRAGWLPAPVRAARSIAPPAPEHAGDVERWRAFWHEARWDVVARQGTWVWDWL